MKKFDTSSYVKIPSIKKDTNLEEALLSSNLKLVLIYGYFHELDRRDISDAEKFFLLKEYLLNEKSLK